MRFALVVAFAAGLAVATVLPLESKYKEALPTLPADPEVTHKVVFHMEEVDGETHTNKGLLVFHLFGGVVPETVGRFVDFSKGTHGHAYEGTVFHRIIPNFMVQGGNMDMGSPPVRFNDENFRLKHDRVGRMLLANAGPDTNGPQFFVTTSIPTHLDGKHVVFGQLVDGWDTLLWMNGVPTGDGDRPVKPVRVAKVVVYAGSAATAPADASSGYPSSLLLFVVAVVLVAAAVAIKLRVWHRVPSPEIVSVAKLA